MGRHLVARQTIEIIATDRREAEALMARTSACAAALTAAIERTLDAFDASGHRIRLDVVEIDLGRCSPASWEAELVAGIERELVARLPRSAVLAEAGPLFPTARPPAALELLSKFARSGRLPWWSDAVDTPAAAIATLLAGPAAPEAVRRLLGLPGAVERFVRQLEPTDLATLVTLAATPRRAGAAQVAIAAMVARVAAATADGRTTTDTWRALLHRAARGEQPEPRRTHDEHPEPTRGDGAGPNPARIPIRPLGATHQPGSHTAGAAPPTSPDDQPAAALAARLAALARTWPGLAALLRHLATRADGLAAPAATTALDALDPDGIPGPATVAAVIEVLVAEGHADRQEATGWLKAIAAGTVAADPHDAIALDNAGLPLVWPFLPAFFDGLGLLDERDFRDEPARHRAVLLLHFLASGERTAPEPRLPLAKLLAGLNLDAVHLPGDALTDAEAAAGEALLAAVIAQAPMLGRISIDGLRASFLLRPGTLATRDGHWLLRVERQSFDILLEHLPWPLAWARLPWMAAPLQIEW